MTTSNEMPDQGAGLVDSHAHLDMEEFGQDRTEVVERALRAGLRAILCPSELTQESSFPIIRGLRQKYSCIIAAAGVHPHRAAQIKAAVIDGLRDLAALREIAAVGEIGLDFHYDFSSPAEQHRAFREQLGLAQQLGLPAIIHSRNAGQEVIRAVREEKFSRRGILHCFTEDWDVAKEMMDHGFFISFSGILTFPKAQELRETAKRIPLDRLLVETDSPFLAPVPHRGRKRNEPAFVVETALVLAELKAVSLIELAEATTRGFFSLFPFEKSTRQC